MRAFALAWVFAFALLVPPGVATHHPDCEPTTSIPEIDTGATGAGRFYVELAPKQDWPIWSTTWVYEEANGIDGLQRSDFFVDDTCGHPELGDRIIY